jgi:GUN4-like/Trypsin-like peptidase domain
MGIEDSIVLLKAKDDRTDIGTGFVVICQDEAQDEAVAYVVTCAHVVNAIGQDNIQVDDLDATVIANGRNSKSDGLDLAVLKVKGLKIRTLDRMTDAQKQDSFTSYGYYDFDNKGTYRRDTIEGKLEKQTTVRSNRKDILAWDLVVTGSDPLKPGCSGAPVLNQQNEVIAVVTHELLEGKKGAAISIGALSELQPLPGQEDIRPQLKQRQAERYRQKFTEAITAQYPLDSDVRDRLKKIQQSLALQDEDVAQIEAPIVAPKEAAYQAEIASEKGIDYAQLRDRLKAQDWQAADQETADRMCEVMGRQKEGWLRVEDVQKFPCQDLQTIDRLWVKYSNGHFGFSVQKKIWQSCGSPTSSGKDWDRFCVKVGWQNPVATAYVNYSDLKFEPDRSPLGELPCLGWKEENEVEEILDDYKRVKDIKDMGWMTLADLQADLHLTSRVIEDIVRDNIKKGNYVEYSWEELLSARRARSDCLFSRAETCRL